MDAQKRLERITVNPDVFGGQPIIRGHRLAVEHVRGMAAADDSPETILEGYPWLEAEASARFTNGDRRRISKRRMKIS